MFSGLDVLYGGLGIIKLQCLIKKIRLIIFRVIFLNFLSSKPNPGSGSGSGSGPYRYLAEILDPDPDQ